MTVPAGIKSYLDELDFLQERVFDKIESITNINESKEASENISIEFTRSKISKEVTKLILQFEELVTVLNAQILNYRDIKEVQVLGEVYKDKLVHLRIDLREAQMESYRQEEEIVHKQRVKKFGTVPERPKTMEEMKHELFEGRSQEEENRLREKSAEDQLVEQNKSITATLQSTRQLMTTSIVQTELNIDSLEQQTKDLSAFDILLNELTSTLRKSGNIVKFIEKQDKQDKYRIYLSIGFLLVCCAWVVWRRILKVPVKILLWSILRIFRVFLWFLPKSTEKDILESVDVSTGISIATATFTASSIDTQSMASEETVVQTWEQIVETATSLIKDEL
ncbi:Protein transport protein sec20 [Yamadazyma tenuis]|uniref:Sec20-domain-containing protein n=1 Tax=Candida tenuis (strain ATCC 10573 / BCRC 21748 / CBS 615 / JCM 9827 / NBRC 10315 / NRRL Y-1498 / VKM Y-70) TaxID=590646 RepID=G3B1P9_CANTC|nr:Sec20-domain-containing protein [Yamadazyma tenuis ATCC 10573]EGV64501.1 Sec20-domain-containing protein [Yamadazyma tenuis ATCC 10573]WEJ97264.1 Protein transport protein sec20 [Yamadazyma tenuis]